MNELPSSNGSQAVSAPPTGQTVPQAASHAPAPAAQHAVAPSAPHVAAPSTLDAVANELWRGWAILLVALAVFTTGAFTWLGLLARAHELSVARAERAERPRDVVMEAVRAWLELVGTPASDRPVAPRVTLAASLGDLESRSLSIPRELENSTADFADRVRALLRAPDSLSGDERSALTSMLLAAERELAPALDAEVRRARAESELRGRALREGQQVVLGVVLAFLLFAALAVVKPALAKVTRGRQELLSAIGRLVAIIDSIGEAVLTVDQGGRIVEANREAHALWGYDATELNGMELSSLLAPGCRELGPRLLGEMLGRRTEVEGTRRDGTVVALELVTAVCDPCAGGGFTVAAHDITARGQAAELVRSSQRVYQALVDEALDGMFRVNAAGTWTFVNAAWSELTGFSPEETLGRAFLDSVDPEDRAAVQDAFEQLAQRQRPSCRHEVRFLTKAGGLRWVDLSARPFQGEDGSIGGFSGSFHDVTERKSATDQLESRAFYDPLTKLPNRALFMDRLGRAAHHAARRPDYMFAVLFIDADRFKVVNDSLGHLVGDQLLVGIARRLESCLRLGDTVARFGGDEFAILMDDMEDSGDATRVAERIQKELKVPFHLQGQEVFTSASIGIALSTTGYDRPEDLLRDADIALYRAKALGKARHEMFDPDMHVEAMALMQLEADLRRAVRRGEFKVYYQPIVEAESGAVTRCEALLRWEHPHRGNVPPAEFIPLLEETGLIVPIGEWLLRSVCLQYVTWRNAGAVPPRMAVNLSSRQFGQTNLTQWMRMVLDECGMPPEALELEITESTAMRDVDFSVASLNELAAMGVHVSIDDFGTGHSSLAYLKRFPIGTLKVAQSFVSDVLADAGDQELVHAILAMAYRLKLAVVAEGVETEEQLAFLRGAGCGEVQGDLFSVPLPGDALTEILRDGRLAASSSLAPTGS